MNSSVERIARLGVVLGAAWLVLFGPGLDTAQAADPIPVEIQVIRATEGEPHFDEAIKPLEKQLKKLPYQRFVLKDQSKFELSIGTKVRMQLPNEAWMTIIPKALVKKNTLRIELIIKKLKFRTTVSIAEGATLAVGGPRYGGGALLLAITRK